MRNEWGYDSQPLNLGNQQPPNVYPVGAQAQFDLAYNQQFPPTNSVVATAIPIRQDKEEDEKHEKYIDSNSRSSDYVPLAPDGPYSEADRESYRDRPSNSSRDQLNLPINHRNTSGIVSNTYEDQSSHGMI